VGTVTALQGASFPLCQAERASAAMSLWLRFHRYPRNETNFKLKHNLKISIRTKYQFLTT